MKDKVLFLDFDGVLFDTLKEVYLVNRKLFLGVDLFDEVDEKNYQLYSKYKYLVYNIWMFYYYNPLLFQNTDEKDIPELFTSAISNRNLKNEEEFCDAFLKTRKDLVLNHYDFWNKLEVPYQFFYDIKEMYEKYGINIAVVSKKNKPSIVQRFKSYGFDLNPDLVFAREILDKYSSKGEFMKEYMEQNGFNSAIFVDDNYNNLKTVQNEKIENILALWGNSQPNMKGYSQKEAKEKIENYFISK